MPRTIGAMAPAKNQAEAERLIESGESEPVQIQLVPVPTTEIDEKVYYGKPKQSSVDIVRANRENVTRQVTLSAFYHRRHTYR